MTSPRKGQGQDPPEDGGGGQGALPPQGGLVQHPLRSGGRGTEPLSRHIRRQVTLCRAGAGVGRDDPPGHCPVGGRSPSANWGAVSKRRAHATCQAHFTLSAVGLCQDVHGAGVPCQLSVRTMANPLFTQGAARGWGWGLSPTYLADGQSPC